MTVVNEFTHNGFRVKIYYDQDVSDPHEDMTHGCEFLFEHSSYRLANDPGLHLDDFRTGEELITHLREKGDALVIMHVCMLDHSGVSLSVYDFNDRWDSGIIGLAYVTNENWQECQGTEWTGSTEQVEQAKDMIKAEVETYSLWLNGECYGYNIVDFDNEVMDSCWGFYGNEDVETEAKRAAEYSTHAVKCTGTLNRYSGNVDHEKGCPIHNLTPELTEREMK